MVIAVIILVGMILDSTLLPMHDIYHVSAVNGSSLQWLVWSNFVLPLTSYLRFKPREHFGHISINTVFEKCSLTSQWLSRQVWGAMLSKIGARSCNHVCSKLQLQLHIEILNCQSKDFFLQGFLGSKWTERQTMPLKQDLRSSCCNLLGERSETNYQYREQPYGSTPKALINFAQPVGSAIGFKCNLMCRTYLVLMV